MLISNFISTFAVQFWKIYTIRIIPLCKHSEWHAGVALFLYYPTRYIPSARAFGNEVARIISLCSSLKATRTSALSKANRWNLGLLLGTHTPAYTLASCVYASFVYFGHLPWLFTPTLTTTHLPLSKYYPKKPIPP